MKITTIAFLISLMIILILSAIIIFRKPTIIENSNDTAWKDSVTLLHKEIEKSHLRQIELQKAYDSLSSIEPHIITRTNDKIKFIYSTATPNDLDSIIRSNWKTNSRYR